MKHILKTTDLVKEILESVPATRNNDMILYYEMCLKIDKTVLKLPFWNVILDLKGHGLPNIATVERARRKVQRMHPELAGTKKTEIERSAREEIFRSYANT